MSLRDTLMLKDGRARPPSVLRKVCVHNGSALLEPRFRGDLAFDIDFERGIQAEVYSCLQCGHTVSAADIMSMYQRYMLDGTPIIVGRNIRT